MELHHQAKAARTNVAVIVRRVLSAETPWEIDPRYLPAADSEALRRIFRAHRVASALPVLPAITGAAPEITCPQGISSGTVSELRIADRALRTLASTGPANASNAAASRRGPPVALRAGRATPLTRLVANANAWSGWPSRDVCLLTRTGPEWRSADIVVLSKSRDDQARPTPDRSEGGNIASSTEPPSCRGPPQVVGHRSRAAAMTPAKLSDKSARQATAVGALPTANPVVRDNLGRQVPVCAAELDVIETYLDQVLRDLLVSSTAGSEQEQA